MVSFATEGWSPYQHMSTMGSGKFWRLSFAIFISCVNATVLNLSQLFVTKDLGAVGSQVAGQAKSVLTIMGGMVLFEEPVTVVQIAGFLQVLVGVFMYSTMDQSKGVKQRLASKASAPSPCNAAQANGTPFAFWPPSVKSRCS